MTIRTAQWLLIAMLFWLLLPGAAAQAAFITDKIVVEVHAQRFGQGAVLKKLSSGSSVEVLMSDGKFSRIRTTDNITGWIDSKYLSNEKPTQLEYLELLSKSKTTEGKLRAAEEKLASASEATAGSASISDEDLAKLQKQAKDAKWMQVEMNKARDHAKKMEAKLKSKSKQTSTSQAELDTLRAQNKQLEQRLAATILITEQQEAQMTAAQQTAAQETETNAPTVAPPQDDSWTVNIEWFLGSILTAIVIGIALGINWLDKRMRQRHGGFRIY